MGRAGNYLSLTRLSCECKIVDSRGVHGRKRCGFLPGVRVFIILWGFPKDTRRHYTAGRTRFAESRIFFRLDPPHPPSALSKHVRSSPAIQLTPCALAFRARVSLQSPRCLSMFNPRPACFSKSQRMLCRVPSPRCREHDETRVVCT